MTIGTLSMVLKHARSSNLILYNLTHFKRTFFSSVHICAVGGNKGKEAHARTPTGTLAEGADAGMETARPPGIEHRHPWRGGASH